MAEQATQRTTIGAPVARCWDVVLDMDAYPQWAKDVKHAEVITRDESGRPLEVAFEASAFGRTTFYTLHYDYSHAPDRLTWKLVRGDIMTSMEGSYTFGASADGPESTDVTYDLAIELAMPLPGFVKRRAEVRILNSLKELRARVESAS